MVSMDSGDLAVRELLSWLIVMITTGRRMLLVIWQIT